MPIPSQKRYNSYSQYFKRKFGGRVQKLSVDAGFTCPNRDGTVATGGCTYCNNDAFNPSYCHPQKTVAQQIGEGIEFHRKRYRRASQYLAYFQAYSNTYAPLSRLKAIYKEALSFPGVVGLVVGTRVDCMDEEKLAYFAQLAKTHYVILEYGVESTNEETLRQINRGHTWQEAQEMIQLTHAYGISCGVHLIMGLPGESSDEMIDRAAEISALPVTTVKLHQLQIVKGTRMAAQYLKDPAQFRLFTLDEYIHLVVRFVERLRPDIVVERFSGEMPPRFLVSAPWENLRADQVAVLIEKELDSRDTWQGRLYKPVR